MLSRAQILMFSLWFSGGHENHFVKIEPVSDFTCRHQVRVVGGIERSAHHAHASWSRVSHWFVTGSSRRSVSQLLVARSHALECHGHEQTENGNSERHQTENDRRDRHRVTFGGFGKDGQHVNLTNLCFVRKLWRVSAVMKLVSHVQLIFVRTPPRFGPGPNKYSRAAKSDHSRTWLSPTTSHFVVVNSASPIGPRACSFWVEIPISAPKPNSPPSVKRVEAFTMTAAESTSAMNRSLDSTLEVKIASV